MFRTVVLLVFVALTCCITNLHAHESRSYTRSRYLPENSTDSLVQSTLFIADQHTFAYAICKDTKPNVEKLCNVTQVLPHNDRTCNDIRIFAGDDKQLFLGGYFQLVPFAPDHFVVVWWDNSVNDEKKSSEKKQNFKFTILNMAKCTSAHLDFPIDKVVYGFLPSLVLYSNSVDVVLNSKSTCAGAEKCKLSYDLEGKQIDGIKTYEPELCNFASPVSAASPEKGIFMYVKNETFITVLLVDSAGQGKVLMTAPIEPQEYSQRIVLFNNAHELYSMCRLPSQESKQIRCSQFDSQGNTKLNAAVNVPEQVNSMAVRSLAEGGILLATTGCNEAKPDSNCQKINVRRIDENGETIKKVEFEGPGAQCYGDQAYLELRIAETNDDHFCLDFSCLPTPSSLNYTTKCISKKNLL